jgi:acetolactate synthase-1/2/3 large subunit
VHARVAAARARAFAAHAGFSGDRAIAVAARRLADRARATVDAGAHMFPATLLWPAPAPNELLISNGLSTMGFALPAAIGAALAEPARPVVAVTGDGGLMMCVSEIATAVRERLRIITLVLADARLSLIDIKQQRRRLRDDGVALGGACWATIAEGFGAAGFAASSEAELDRAIDGALAHDGPSVIEAKIDPSNYGAVLEAVRG